MPSLIHVIGGRNIALLNSAVTKCETVVTEAPNGWNAGPSSADRSFARQAAWIAR